jgi:pre-60S factor REI1
MVSKLGERHALEHDEGDDIEISDASSLDQVEYDSAQCLFCNPSHGSYPTLDDNLIHMQKMHGLFLPEPGRLLVHIETLINYCHLVISGYCECLYCGTQRNNAEGAQQHMMAKGHCKIDISREDSEFRDFYDFTSDHDDNSDCDGEGREPKTLASTSLVQPTDTSLRLPSGKILSHRSGPKSPPQRRRVQPEHETKGKPGPGLEGSQRPLPHPRPDDDGVRGGASTALTRAEKRDLGSAGQLASLRASDRSSLLHMPSSQQRALLATQKKQVESARKTQKHMQSRVERMGNKTLMKHFVPDTPGRSNG